MKDIFYKIQRQIFDLYCFSFLFEELTLSGWKLFMYKILLTSRGTQRDIEAIPFPQGSNYLSKVPGHDLDWSNDHPKDVSTFLRPYYTLPMLPIQTAFNISLKLCSPSPYLIHKYMDLVQSGVSSLKSDNIESSLWIFLNPILLLNDHKNSWWRFSTRIGFNMIIYWGHSIICMLLPV